MHGSEKQFSPLILLLALSVTGVWGFSFIAIELALKHVSPSVLVPLRFIPTLFFFLPVTLKFIFTQKGLFTAKDYLQISFFGLFGVIGYNFALNTGQGLIPASIAALVIALNPTSIAIVASVALREYPSKRVWGGLAVSLVGITVVILARSNGNGAELQVDNIKGVLFTLGAPVSWGIYSAGLRKYAPKIGAMRTTSISMTFGSIPLLGFLFTSGFQEALQIRSIELWGSFMFLALACTVFGFTGWAAVLKRLPAAKAGSFIYLVPLIAAFASYFILQETIDLAFIAGTVLVLSGVMIVSGRIPFLNHLHRKSIQK